MTYCLPMTAELKDLLSAPETSFNPFTINCCLLPFLLIYSSFVLVVREEAAASTKAFNSIPFAFAIISFGWGIPLCPSCLSFLYTRTYGAPYSLFTAWGLFKVVLFSALFSLWTYPFEGNFFGSLLFGFCCCGFCPEVAFAVKASPTWGTKPCPICWELIIADATNYYWICALVVVLEFLGPFWVPRSVFAWQKYYCLFVF